MNVPSAIARNKLAVIVANSIASNKVLGQYDLYQRVANLLCQGDMTSKEIITNHTRLYRDLAPPPMERVDSVINDFLTNMIVIWKNVEGKIVFSLSPEIREMANALRPKVKTHSGANFDELVSALSKGDYSKTNQSIHSQIVYFIHHNGPSTVDQLYDANVHRRVGHIEIFKDVLDEMQREGVLDRNITDTWLLTDNFKEQVETYRQYSKNTEGAISKIDKVSSFEELANLRSKDDFREAKTVEGVIVYILRGNQEPWELERISNDLAEFWTISDNNLAEVLQGLVDKKVLTLSKPTFEANPVWCLSTGFLMATNVHRHRQPGSITVDMRQPVSEPYLGVAKELDFKAEYRANIAEGLLNSELHHWTSPQLVASYLMNGAGITWNALVSLLDAAGMSEKAASVNLKELKENEVVAMNPPDTLNPLISFTSTFNAEMQKKKEENTATAAPSDATDGIPVARNKSREVHARAASELRKEERSYRHQKSMSDEAAVRSTEPGKADHGDTEYLMSSPVNASRLLAAKEQLMSAGKEANADTEQMVSASRTAMAAHQEAYHAIAEETFGDVLDPKGIETSPAKPEFILEFMGTKQTVAAARETYDDVMAILSKAEDNSMLVKLFPPGAFENLKQYVEQFDSLGTQF